MKKATAFYKRSVLITCPHKDCGKTVEFRHENPLNVSAIPQVGSVVNCISCAKQFQIAHEEVL